MTRTVLGACNFRIIIEQPVIDRKSVRDALTPLLGKPINDDTLAEAKTIVAALLKPVITVKPILLEDHP